MTFTDPDVVRTVNLAAGLAIIAVLSFRHFRVRPYRSVDDQLRSATCVLVFAVMALGSGVNVRLDVEMGPTVPWFAVALVAYLTALLAPWRWRLRRR